MAYMHDCMGNPPMAYMHDCMGNPPMAYMHDCMGNPRARVSTPIETSTLRLPPPPHHRLVLHPRREDHGSHTCAHFGVHTIACDLYPFKPS